MAERPLIPDKQGRKLLVSLAIASERISPILSIFQFISSPGQSSSSSTGAWSEDSSSCQNSSTSTDSGRGTECSMRTATIHSCHNRSAVEQRQEITRKYSQIFSSLIFTLFTVLPAFLCRGTILRTLSKSSLYSAWLSSLSSTLHPRYSPGLTPSSSPATTPCS